MLVPGTPPVLNVPTTVTAQQLARSSVTALVLSEDRAFLARNHRSEEAGHPVHRLLIVPLTFTSPQTLLLATHFPVSGGLLVAPVPASEPWAGHCHPCWDALAQPRAGTAPPHQHGCSWARCVPAAHSSQVTVSVKGWGEAVGIRVDEFPILQTHQSLLPCRTRLGISGLPLR